MANEKRGPRTAWLKAVFYASADLGCLPFLAAACGEDKHNWYLHLLVALNLTRQAFKVVMNLLNLLPMLADSTTDSADLEDLIRSE